MIKEIRLINWKSFSDSTLYIDPLTVLIGTNASGKSNIIEALVFIKMISGKYTIEEALKRVRGGVECAALQPNKEFTIEMLLEKDTETDYEYSITVSTEGTPEAVNERLSIIQKESRKKLKVEFVFCSKVKVLNDDEMSEDKDIRNDNKIREDSAIWTDDKMWIDREIIKFEIFGEVVEISKIQYDLRHSILSQIINLENSKEIKQLQKMFENIFFLQPKPSLMREYCEFSEELKEDASNLSGFIAKMHPKKRVEIEEKLSLYASRLPEFELQKIWIMTVGINNRDAILCCEEKWGKAHKTMTFDARTMSEGTLSFIAILTTLLTRPENSLVLIEQVDDGLHPSRSNILLNMLKEIGKQRKIDILITTHNQALMDELGIEMIPFIQVVHREPKEGVSKITLLEEIENLPKLLASGSIGELSAKGKIEKSLLENGGSNGEG